MNLVTFVQKSAIATLSLLCFTTVDAPVARAVALAADGAKATQTIYTQATPGEAGFAAYQEGVALEKEGTPESLRAAIAKYEEAIALFRAANLVEQEAVAMHTLGHAYTNAEELERSAETFRIALEMWQALGDRETVVALQEDVTFSTLGWGMALEAEGSEASVTAALTEYDTAIALVDGDVNRGNRAWLWQQKGYAFQKLGDPESAIGSFSTALKLWQAVGNPENEKLLREVTIGTMYNWGIQLQQEGSPLSREKAIVLYSTALPIFEGDELPELRGRVLHVMGHAHEDLGDTSSALGFYKQALTVWQSVGDSEQEAALQEDIERLQ